MAVNLSLYNMKNIVNIERVKQINTAAVYRLIDQQGPISRVQIAELSQLAAASITKITRQLLSAKLIREVAQQQSTGGRRATSLMSETSFRFISVRLGRGYLDLAVYDLTGYVYAKQAYQLPAQPESQLLPKLLGLIETFIKTLNSAPMALALTLSGLVSSGDGIIRYAPYYELSNVPLKTYLNEALKLPIFIGNDTRAMALAEHYFGQATNIDDSVLVSIHTGTSAGIIMNAQVFMHDRRDLAEIGHIQVDPFGEHCHCGHIGCLETICSNPAILRQAHRSLQQGVSSRLIADDPIEHIYQLAAEGDDLCERLVKHAVQALGKTLASVVNLLNPQVILLSGEICQSGDLLFAELRKVLAQQTLPTFYQQLELRAAHFQNHPTIGGLALIKRAMLDGELLMELITRQLS
ncbi:ROK family protein [Celerinatantimonas yamalensis]|uniref:ROK family transcriptional regulator n=1 Tax=Celerinatantimonas yamalensis TaxID=559956 RepID=A0ABW9G2N2_9GAMM